MSDKIRLDLVTPYGTVYSGEVEEVTATGSEGEFGVLPGHANFMTTLKVGTLRAKAGAVTEAFFINSGFADVGPNRMTVLTDSAERATEIDVERAMEAKRRAEDILKKQEHVEFAVAEAALERAVTRIGLAKEHSRDR